MTIPIQDTAGRKLRYGCKCLLYIVRFIIFQKALFVSSPGLRCIKAENLRVFPIQILSQMIGIQIIQFGGISQFIALRISDIGKMPRRDNCVIARSQLRHIIVIQICRQKVILRPRCDRRYTR